MRIDNFAITPEILTLVAEIDEFKGAWRSLGALAPERLDALRRRAMVENLESVIRITGGAGSKDGLESLMPTAQGLPAETEHLRDFKTAEEREAAGYATTLQNIIESWASIPPTEAYLKQMHRDLFRYREKGDRHRGEYKKMTNSVAAFDEAGKGTGIVFKTASPFDTPRLMKELVAWYGHEEESARLHPLPRIAVFIGAFLEIHPFQDGNGRLSRLLTTLLLLRAGYAHAAYSGLESVFEAHRQDYHRALRHAKFLSHAPSPPWVVFFLQSLKRQKQGLEERIAHDKWTQAALPELSAKIMDHVKQHGRVAMRDLIRLTAISRNTLKDHFRRLTQAGYLVRQGVGKGSWYVLP